MNLLPILMLAIGLGSDPVSGCVWIRAENDGSGAGFLVDAKKRWVVTCRHVVADRDTVDVYFAWSRNGSLVTEKNAYLGNRVELRQRGLLVRGTVKKKSDDADLAIIELESLPDAATALPFSTTPVQPGDPLRTVGHRLDLDTLFNFSTGSVRQSGRLANGYHWRGKKLAVNADAILAQLPIEEGDSGGPVLNGKSEAVGMVSALRRQAPGAAVAISAAEIRKLLDIAEPKPADAPGSIGETLIRTTVWVRPTATDVHLAGVLIEKNFVLTSARGLGSANVVGIAFPLRKNEKWIGEREPYRDPVGLSLKNAWGRGVVISRDPARDLALIAIDDVSMETKPVPLATSPPVPGDAIHAMSHPGGVEFAWVYASGSVRQCGRLALAEGDNPVRVQATVLQLPAQSGSPGGPVLNAKGELIGVLSMRESNQQTGYAATPDEIAYFLDLAMTQRPAKSLTALYSRLNAFADRSTSAFATALAHFGNEQPLEQRERIDRFALAIDSHAFAPRSFLWNLLVKAGRVEEAESVLDAGVENNGIDQTIWLGVRAVRRIGRQEWRGARGDLERILEVYPRDIASRRLLVRVLLELKKDDEAAAAVGDLVRLQKDGLAFLADDLLQQAGELAKKFPDAPAIPSNWLRQAIGAAAKWETDPARRAEYEVVLKAAANAVDDAERLRRLRGFLTTLKPLPGR